MEITKYVLKVWLLTSVLAPMIGLWLQGSENQFWTVYMLILSSGLLFSIPTVLAMLFFLNLAPIDWKIFKIKMINFIIGIIFVLATFWFVDNKPGPLSQTDILWVLSYIVIMGICIFIFKLNRKFKTTQNA